MRLRDEYTADRVTGLLRRNRVISAAGLNNNKPGDFEYVRLAA